MIEFDKEASSVGSCCPMPLIELERAVKTMQQGMVLRMIGDDPIFESGVRDYCDARGFKVLDIETESDQVAIYIQV